MINSFLPVLLHIVEYIVWKRGGRCARTIWRWRVARHHLTHATHIYENYIKSWDTG